MRGLAVSPPRFSKYCEIAIPQEFSEKKIIGGRSWSGAPSAEEGANDLVVMMVMMMMKITTWSMMIHMATRTVGFQ